MKQFYQFDGFCLDEAGRTLLRNGSPVPLTPKAFDTLLVLVRHSGRAVAKDDLLNEVWRDTFVEEATLAQNISTLRKALGRGSHGEQFIETVTKYGYRFSAQVKELNNDPTETVVIKTLTRARIVAEESEDSNDDAAQQYSQSQALVNTARDRVTLPQETNTRQAMLSAFAKLKRRPELIILLVLMVVVLPLIVVIAKYVRRDRPASTATLPFQKMRIAKLTNNGNVTRAVLSPDGKYVAYAMKEGAQQSLWLRQVIATNSVQLVPPKKTAYLQLGFNNESTNLFFVTYENGSMIGVLYQLPILGGIPRKILEDIDSGAAISPDGQRIAFIRQVPSKREGELILAKIDGSEMNAIAVWKRPDVLSDRVVAWSPDGKTIVTAVRFGDNTDPYMSFVEVRLSDNSQRTLTQRKFAWIGQTAWLSDGSGLIFNGMETRASDFSAPLWLLSYADGAVSRVTNDLNSYDGASLTLNNSSLASVQTNRVANFWAVPLTAPGSATRFSLISNDQYGEQMGVTCTARKDIVFGSTASGNLDIWVMDADGRNPRQLTFDPQPDLKPTASPDGRFIVFVSWRTGAPHVWRVDLDGNNLKQLTNGDAESFPSISPDGKWVFFASIRQGQSTLWKVPVDGGNPVKVTDDSVLQSSISPDGKRIAYFQKQESGPKPKIAVISVSGGTPVKTLDAADDVFPMAGLRWTPDGHSLSYVVTTGEVSNVWSQSLDDTKPHSLTDFSTDQIFRFDWSPDGKYLVLERGTNINDVVLLHDIAR